MEVILIEDSILSLKETELALSIEDHKILKIVGTIQELIPLAKKEKEGIFIVSEGYERSEKLLNLLYKINPAANVIIISGKFSINKKNLLCKKDPIFATKDDLYVLSNLIKDTGNKFKKEVNEISLEEKTVKVKKNKQELKEKIKSEPSISEPLISVETKKDYKQKNEISFSIEDKPQPIENSFEIEIPTPKNKKNVEILLPKDEKQEDPFSKILKNISNTNSNTGEILLPIDEEDNEPELNNEESFGDLYLNNSTEAEQNNSEEIPTEKKGFMNKILNF